MRSKLSILSGFSLVELIVVMTIVAVLSTTLLLNFRVSATSATARRQTAQIVIGNIRRAQSMAIVGSSAVCGYGIHLVSPTSYIIYTRPLSAGACRSDLASRNYDSAGDSIVTAYSLSNPNMAFVGPAFSDIYFELPEPKTYIGNNSLPNVSTAISIAPTGKPSTTITVYTSGKIDID